MLPKDGRIHFSNLKEFAKSPAHYALSCEAEREDSTAMLIGRGVHSIVLEGKEPLVYSGIRRGKEWEEFKLATDGNDIVNNSEFSIINSCADSIKKNTFAQEVLSRCTSFEKYVEWDRNGIPCAGRIDAFGDDVLVEVKTAQSVLPKKFLWQAQNMNYDAQMAWYDIGLGTKYQQFSTPWRDHYIIAVETKAPFTSIVFKLDDLRIDQGHTKCEEWLEAYRECASTEFWPSYAREQPVPWDGEIIIEDETEDE